jgi:hypothetical protein
MRSAALALVVLAACSSTGDDGSTPDSFIAFSSSFAGFRAWTSFHSDGPAAGTVPPEVLGPRTQYINKAPPAGSTEFPIGTMVVEARENGTLKIFAGVKRGASFNASGAKNWEWFELTEHSDLAVTIFWRGVGPPAGDTYGGDPDGGCNSCHAACGAANDYVCSPKLQLGSF